MAAILDAPSFLGTVTILLFILAYYVFLLGHRRTLPLPPGPRGLPILGVWWEHPKEDWWKTYLHWDQQYGNKGLVYFNLLGRKILILNTLNAAEELLKRRALNYSDRQKTAFGCELMQRQKMLAFLSNGDRFRKYRKLLHQSFNSTACHEYWPVVEHRGMIMINNILSTPDSLVRHLRRYAVDTIMKIAYGYNVKEDNDRVIARAEDSAMIASLSIQPGYWLVDSFPILRFLPDWFPGAGFKRLAREWRQKMFAQASESLELVKKQIDEGTAPPSFTSSHLLSSDPSMSPEEKEDYTLHLAAGLFGAGTDTTVSAMQTFIYAMMCFPEVQIKAQNEVDEFIAHERRIPMLKDRGLGLPYLEATLKEVLRWVPVAPLGVPHCARNADTYEGFHIPAGTLIFGNIWAITHNADTYPNPNVFDPSRFLGSTPQPDPRNVAFGFGRRICPGLHHAENLLWVEIALMLAALNVDKGVDERGIVIELGSEIQVTASSVSHLKPFKYRITPRSEQRTAFLRETLQAHTQA